MSRGSKDRSTMKVRSEKQQLGLYRMLNTRLASKICKSYNEPVIKCNLFKKDNMISLRRNQTRLNYPTSSMG